MEACEGFANNSDPVALKVFKDKFYRVAVPCLMMIAVASVLANVFVVGLARFMKSNQLTPAIRLCLGLAAADAWTSAIMGAGLLLHSYLPYVQRACLHSCLAYVLEGLRLGAILTSVLHLLSISLNHYMAITRSADYKRWISPCRVWLLIVVMWLAPMLCITASFAFVPERGFRVRRCRDRGELIKRLEFRLSMTSLLVLPLLTLVFVYVLIVTSLQKMDQQFRVRTQQQTAFVRNRKKMIQTALLIVGSFVIGWIPGAVWYLTPVSALVSLKNSAEGIIALICIGVFVNITMILKGLINPTIYALRVPEFKEALAVFRQQLLSNKRFNSAYNTLRSAKLPRGVLNGRNTVGGQSPDHELINTDPGNTTVRVSSPAHAALQCNGQPTRISAKLIDRTNACGPQEGDCML